MQIPSRFVPNLYEQFPLFELTSQQKSFAKSASSSFNCTCPSAAAIPTQYMTTQLCCFLPSFFTFPPLYSSLTILRWDSWMEYCPANCSSSSAGLLPHPLLFCLPVICPARKQPSLLLLPSSSSSSVIVVASNKCPFPLQLLLHPTNLSSSQFPNPFLLQHILVSPSSTKIPSSSLHPPHPFAQLARLPLLCPLGVFLQIRRYLLLFHPQTRLVLSSSSCSACLVSSSSSFLRPFNNKFVLLSHRIGANVGNNRRGGFAISFTPPSSLVLVNPSAPPTQIPIIFLHKSSPIPMVLLAPPSSSSLYKTGFAFMGGRITLICFLPSIPALSFLFITFPLHTATLSPVLPFWTVLSLTSWVAHPFCPLC